ncbi:MAG: GAF domain-containing protein [Candidatus Omnitrophica bacterium]|nr:GAF domain-containing protein [Candidatus Omnitrophota bacterium]
MEIIIDPKDVPIPQEIRNKWQNIVNILIRIMKVPTALIMKVEFPLFTVFQSADSPENPFKANQVFKLPAGIYCEKTMATKEKNLIPNALKDTEWDKNPSIAAGMISYIGFPIFYPDKNIFGTLCVLDNKENAYSKDYEEVMLQFKEIIESHLALLWQKLILENLLAQQRITEKQLTEKIETIEGINKLCVNREIKIIELNKEIARLEEDLKQARRDIKGDD